MKFSGHHATAESSDAF